MRVVFGALEMKGILDFSVRDGFHIASLLKIILIKFSLVDH